MKLESTTEKYYRFMETQRTSWGPYEIRPMYDEHPDVATYRVNLGCNPVAGDYLISPPYASKILSIVRPGSNVFSGVSFSNMPTIENLLLDGVIVEVSKETAEFEFRLKEEIITLHEKIQSELFSLGDYKNIMNEKRFGLLTRAARDARRKIIKAEHQVNVLQQQVKSNEAKLSELQKQFQYTASTVTA